MSFNELAKRLRKKGLDNGRSAASAAAAKGAGPADAAASGGADFPGATATADLPVMTQQHLLNLLHDADEQRLRLEALRDWIWGAGCTTE